MCFSDSCHGLKVGKSGHQPFVSIVSYIFFQVFSSFFSDFELYLQRLLASPRDLAISLRYGHQPGAPARASSPEIPNDKLKTPGAMARLEKNVRVEKKLEAEKKSQLMF